MIDEVGAYGNPKSIYKQLKKGIVLKKSWVPNSGDAILYVPRPESHAVGLSVREVGGAQALAFEVRGDFVPAKSAPVQPSNAAEEALATRASLRGISVEDWLQLGCNSAMLLAQTRAYSLLAGQDGTGTHSLCGIDATAREPRKES